MPVTWLLFRYMKHIIIILLLGFLLYSCEEDQATREIAEMLEGYWDVEEESELTKQLKTNYYRVYIFISDVDSSRIYIDNFYFVGEGVKAEAIIEGDRLNLVADQRLQYQYGYYTVVNGTGYISDDRKSITWEYSIDDGSGNIDDVTAIYTR